MKKRGVLKYFESADFLFLLLGGDVEGRKGTVFQTKRNGVPEAPAVRKTSPH